MASNGSIGLATRAIRHPQFLRSADTVAPSWRRPAGSPTVQSPRPDPLAIFGAGGDLGRKRLQPALFHLSDFVADCAELVDEPSGDETDGTGPGQRRHPFRQWLHAERDAERLWEQLRVGAYRTAYLATPPDETAKLVDRLVDCAVQLVGVEKPWFPNLYGARSVAARMNGHECRFRFIDHYLARPVVRWLFEQPDPLQFLLGGPITAINGWLLEEAEPSSPAQSVGVSADLLIHLVTVTHRLLPGCTTEVTRVEAGRYEDAPIPNETFAQVDVVADSVDPVPISLTAAKGVPPETAGKMLLVEGPDAILAIDFAHERAELITDRETQCLFQADDTCEAAYVHILRRLTSGDATVGLSISEAVGILGILDEARRKFPDPPPQYEREGFAVSQTNLHVRPVLDD